MSFDYIQDFPGKFLKKRNRFTSLEKKATDLMSSFVSGSITSKELAMAFEEVRKNYLELTNVNGQPTIDEDTPLWLNSLLGLHYVDWYRVQLLKWYYEEHPDELVGETKELFNKMLEANYDGRFLAVCKETLRQLHKVS